MIPRLLGGLAGGVQISLGLLRLLAGGVALRHSLLQLLYRHLRRSLFRAVYRVLFLGEAVALCIRQSQ